MASGPPRLPKYVTADELRRAALVAVIDAVATVEAELGTAAYLDSDDDETFATDSPLLLPTQRATAAYVAAQIAAIPPGGLTITTLDVDLGAPSTRGKFTITDAAIVVGHVVQCWQAPGPYTGKGTRADEAEAQPVQVIAVEVTGAGTAEVRWQTPPLVVNDWSSRSGGGREAAPISSFDRLVNRLLPHQPTQRRLGKVRGHVSFYYMVI